MDDPRIEFLKTISVDKMRVEFSSSPIVLLCGGKVLEKERPEDAAPPIASLRHALSLEFTKFEFFRPEEITDWQADGIYRNLMDIEKDLAGVCSLVVIVLESPGAIAELGAFSQLEDLKQKLMVFTSSDLDSENSFIRFGILRHIRATNKGSVRSYPWKVPVPDEPFSVDKSIVDDIVTDISDQIKSLPNSSLFRSDNNSHIMVLIHQILLLFSALKRKELLEYLIFFNVTINDDELKRKLFLLERFRLVKKDKYSDSTFYIASDESYHRIRFSHSDAIVYDSIRIKAVCLEFYKHVNDRHRLGFLKKVSVGSSHAE